MAAAKTVEQQVADWFGTRLGRIRTSDGYSMTLAGDAIFTDGDPSVVENPVVPFAEFQAAVKVTDIATVDNYKCRGRAIFDDVARTCFGIADAGESDLPSSVVAILPDGWSRQVRDGNYLDITISFTVRVSADLRRRPIK
jgi:hypothetical protein